MKSDYHQKRQAKLERYNTLAEQNQSTADRLINRSADMASAIPMGQPILVGHHSEKRHRNYLSKIHATMAKGIEHEKKAEHYLQRIEAIESNKAISSDDPDALVKLQKKLASLQRAQEFMKACNKIINAKTITDDQKISKLIAFDSAFTEFTASKLLAPDYCGRIGFPKYKLTNNSANMRRIRQRIQELQKFQTLESTEEVIGTIRIVTNLEDNRIQIFFPEKPLDHIRKKCSDFGFHWSPQVGAWQRMISNHALYLARQIANTPVSIQVDNCDNCGS